MNTSTAVVGLRTTIAHSGSIAQSTRTATRTIVVKYRYGRSTTQVRRYLRSYVYEDDDAQES